MELALATGLPIELIDKIWFYVDVRTLIKTRELQSEYINEKLRYYSIDNCCNEGTLINFKYLFYHHEDNPYCSFKLDYVHLYSAVICNQQLVKYIEKYMDQDEINRCYEIIEKVSQAKKIRQV